MRSRSLPIFAALLLLPLCQAGETPRLAVADFDLDPGLEAAVTGRGVANLLQTHLQAKLKGRFRLVNRDAVEKLLQEQKFTQSALVDPGTQKEMGRLLGADFLVTGRALRMGEAWIVTAAFVQVETGEISRARRISAGNAEELGARLPELAEALLLTDEEYEAIEVTEASGPRWLEEGRQAIAQKQVALAVDALRKAVRAKAGPEAEAMLREAETQKARQDLRNGAIATGRRLLAEEKFTEAGAAFARALSTTGFENDAEALEGARQARLRGGEAASRTAHDAALAEAMAAYEKAKGGTDKELWRPVKAALLRARASGHGESAEAKALWDEATRILPVIAAGWPLDGAAAVALRTEAAETWALAVTREVSVPRGPTLRFALVPPGEFDRKAEGATRRIRLSRPYYLGETEVTVGQFSAFVGESGWKTAGENEGAFVLSGGKWSKDAKTNWRTSPWPADDGLPVACVSWNDAQAFCDWLNRSGAAPAGWAFRLPTEAEWEFACRAGSSASYAGGDGEAALSQAGHWWANAQRRAQPAGTLAANAWGLKDMHGNLWEWCLDRADKAFWRDGPAQDPVSLENGAKRVLRGGSWACKAALCASDARDADFPAGRISTDTGFRVALVQEK